MDEKGNGNKGNTEGVVGAEVSAMEVEKSSGRPKIYITFDVAFKRGENRYIRTFVTWIPDSSIQKPITMFTQFMPRG